MGMFEHVGYKNFRTYFEKARRVIKDDGLFMMHTIGQPTRPTPSTHGSRNIFSPVGAALDDADRRSHRGFVDVIDLHNIGPHYDKTLVAWWENFRIATGHAADARGMALLPHVEILPAVLRRRFPRPRLHVWQFVLSTRGVPDGYVFAR